ncbi:hypothetical protein PYW07_001862 [Mythimna separata]|uniref:Reverse transcriptase domain-containing protein n=1 Tax=Mythimna separata TaxID=271217 RepID=A0AAD8DWG5_MYTSE|nr:hypothetical protein PYW07_001862 [Mythimna separata]
MGDFNAQIGKPKTYERKLLGQYGYGKRSPRGDRLIQYAFEHNLKIINTMFKSNVENRWTWISPDKKTRNEIDYITTTKPHLFSKFEVLNSLHFGTDHRLLRATLNLNTTKKSRRNFTGNSSTLKNIEEREIYIKNLSERIPELLETHHKYTANEYYQMIESAVKSSLKSKPNSKKRSILTKKATDLMKKRSNLQNKPHLNKKDREDLKKLYKQTNKEIKLCYETHRMDTFKKHIMTSRSAKKAFKEIDRTKTWIPSLQHGSTNTKSRNNIISIATDFYTNLYSQPNSTQCIGVNQPKNTSSVEIFNEPEILKQISKLKTDKSPGPDGIVSEFIIHAKTLLLSPLTLLFNKILDEEAVPQQWAESEIILLYKKGDPADIGNYRPISLMPCFYKLFASCLLERISSEIDSFQPIEQAGFRKGYSTTDHIHALDQVIQKYLEYRKPLYIAFIDFKKAFDSISHNSIWEALDKQNINAKYINIIKNIYSKSISRVRLDRVGDSININRGVRQGDPISPKLFIAVLHNIMADLSWSKRGINIKGKHLSHLRFADDIVILAENAKELNEMINDLQTASEYVGLEMNLSKTKVMTNSKMTPILVNEMPLEYVNDYIYLGKQISFKKTRNIEEIDRRIDITWKKYWAHKEILKSKLPIKMKKMVLDSAILPCLTYGCQTWIFDSKAKNKIQTTQRAMERSCLSIKLSDRVRNTEIRHKTKVTDALTFSQSLKWRWAGHLARYTDDRWTISTTNWKGPKGSRGKGRPCARWQDEIVENAGQDWAITALDREAWNSLEEAFTRRGSTFQACDIDD